MMDIRRPHRWWLVLPAIVLVMTFATAATAKENPSQARTLSDADVVHAIEMEMASDESVPSYAIYVACEDGVVTLSGSVDNVLARQRATRIARSTRGAEAVVNRIHVTPVPRSDGQIRSDVIRALRDDPATEAWQIDPQVREGTVTLTGTVDSWAEHNLAAQVAAGVRGVREIQNEIIVKRKTQRPDDAIRAEIERRMDFDVWVDDGWIDVHVNDGAVRLTGKTGSAFEKARAASDGWVAGVTSVDDSGLEVVDGLRNRMRRERLATPDDDAIREAIVKAFAYDPRVSALTPNVAVDDGVVTLSGFVTHLAAKHAATEDARNVIGVARVHNDLKIRPPKSLSDVTVEANVRRALRRDPYVHPYSIDVEVRNGLVTLTGDAHSAYERDRASEVAARTIGVREIQNLLDLPTIYDPLAFRSLEVSRVPPVMKTDAEIEDDIRAQLFWSPFVESNQLQVSVHNGIATLRGTVDSWSERKAARDNAYDGGAVAVVDQIRVDPFGS